MGDLREKDGARSELDQANRGSWNFNHTPVIHIYELIGNNCMFVIDRAALILYSPKKQTWKRFQNPLACSFENYVWRYEKLRRIVL